MSARLWIRADLRRRFASLVLLTLLVGLAGAVAIAGVAGARRTTTSWDRLREAEDAADIFFFAQLFDGPVSQDEIDTLRSIPGGEIAGAEIVVLMPGLMGLERSGDMGLVYATDDASLPVIVRNRHMQGRLPDPDRPEEVVVNEAVADELDLHVGDPLPLRTAPLEVFDECRVSPACEAREAPTIDATVVGIVRQSDDLDTDAFNKYLVFAGPRMQDLLTDEHPTLVFVGDIVLDEGTSAASFVAEMDRRLPDRFGVEIADPGSASVHAALRVESEALLALAAIAAIAGLATGAQGLARHLAAGAADHRTLMALGMTRQGRALALLCSGLLVAVAGTVVAVVGAIAASPLLPLGLARQAEPDPGADVDLPVLALGALIMLAALIALFGLLAWRRAEAGEPAAAGRALRPLGTLPLGVALGAGLAFRGWRRGGLATGALAGVIVALTLGVGAAVLTLSNDALQHDERLYGQPWQASVTVAPEAEDAYVADLSARPELGAVGIARTGEVPIHLTGGDERAVPAVGFGRTRWEMPVVVLEGREPTARDEVAAGSALLDDLGLDVGDTVTASDGTSLPIVGRVVVPIAGSDFPDESFLLTLDGFDAHGSSDLDGETQDSLVTFRAADGYDIDELLGGDLGDAALLMGSKAHEPADVKNLQGIGRLPLAVGVLTAVLAGLALAHALLVTERRSRRELATLRALGMRRRDLAGVVLSAGATLAAVGLAVGVPLGIVAGRTLWEVITTSVLVADRPSTPLGAIGTAALATAIVTAAAAAVPAIRAHRMRTALVLREQ